jgi:hypothetical protein
MGWTTPFKKQGVSCDSATEKATASYSDISMNEPNPPSAAVPLIDTTASQILSAWDTPILDLDSSLNESSFNSGTRSTLYSAKRDVQCDALAVWLHTKAEERVWTTGKPGEGVFVKKTKGLYAVSPADVATDGTALHQAITMMNVRVRWFHHMPPSAANADSL